jgi:site-specific recombinase XerD
LLRTAFRPDDWIAVLLKSHETGGTAQRVGPLSLIAHPRVQAWLRAQSARRFSVYVAWNWIAVFFSPDASFVVVTERPSEEEERMTADDIRWDQYPTVAREAVPRAWLGWQANRQLAKHTIETYGRSLEDFLRFLGREAVRPEDTTRAHVAAYVRDLLTRPNPRQPKVVHLDSGAGLANARFCSGCLSFDSFSITSSRRDSAQPILQAGCSGVDVMAERLDAPLIHRHRRLPWIPTEEQWQALLSVMRGTSVRSRLMFAMSYDAALRRHELLTLDTTDIDPAHCLIRIRAEQAKNRCERVVPYSVPTAQLYTSYLHERRAISRARGPLFCRRRIETPAVRSASGPGRKPSSVSLASLASSASPRIPFVISA